MCQQSNEKRTLMFLIGGAGFIGKHIIEQFNTDKTIDLVIIDRHNAIEALKELDITNITTKFIPMNLNESSLKRIVDDHHLGIEKNMINLCLYKDIHIFHLASPVGVANHQVSTFYEAMDINQNVYNFARFLRNELDSSVVKKANLKFWYTSSSEVYGDIDNGKLFRPEVKLNTFYDINQKLGGFRSDYIYQKILAEELFSQLNDIYTVKIMRLFNIVGKHQDPSKGVFNKFIKDIVDDKQVVCSKSIRCYTKVSILMDYIRNNLNSISNDVCKTDIVSKDFETSLTSEELYIYLFTLLNGKYMSNAPRTLNYKINNLPEEITIRGRRDTLSYSEFCREFSFTVDLIVTKMCLQKPKMVDSDAK